MVRFGEMFKDLVFADWAEGYIMYHHLKPLVKRVGLIMGDRDRVANLRFVQRGQEDAEEAFWLALEQEIGKANNFYQVQMKRVEEQMSSITWEMDKVKRLQEVLIDEGLLTDFLPNGLYGPKTLDAMARYKGTVELPDASPASLDEIANFYATLDRLQEFVILNYVGELIDLLASSFSPPCSHRQDRQEVHQERQVRRHAGQGAGVAALLADLRHSRAG